MDALQMDRLAPPVLIIMATAVIYAMAVVATVTDVREGKVHNWLTAPGALLGLVLNTAFLGLDGLLSSLLGLAIGLSIWFLMPLIGRPLGGGDVKFLMAIGALLGPVYLLHVMLLSGLWAGLMAIVMAARRGTLVVCCKAAFTWLVVPRPLRRGEAGGTLHSADPGLRVPFAAATGLAAVTATILLHTSLLR